MNKKFHLYLSKLISWTFLQYNLLYCWEWTVMHISLAVYFVYAPWEFGICVKYGMFKGQSDSMVGNTLTFMQLTWVHFPEPCVVLWARPWVVPKHSQESPERHQMWLKTKKTLGFLQGEVTNICRLLWARGTCSDYKVVTEACHLRRARVHTWQRSELNSGSAPGGTLDHMWIHGSPCLLHPRQATYPLYYSSTACQFKL